MNTHAKVKSKTLQIQDAYQRKLQNVLNFKIRNFYMHSCLLRAHGFPIMNVGDKKQ